MILFCWTARRRSKTSTLPSLLSRTGYTWWPRRKSGLFGIYPVMWHGLIQNEQATKKLQVIINRYSSHEAVTIEQIGKAVRLPIACKIPNNYGELVRSINIGEPLSVESKSDFSVLMTAWATALVKGAAAPTAQDTAAGQEPAKKKFALWK